MLLNRYLEATLRKARFEEKVSARDNECSFQPVTNISRRRSLSAPTKSAKSFSEASRLSRYDLLYMDGERKRQRNIDARFDRFQKGTGELVYELNRKWSECERSKQFNPLLQSTQEAELLYRHVFAYPYVSFFFKTPFTSVSLRTSSTPFKPVHECLDLVFISIKMRFVLSPISVSDRIHAAILQNPILGAQKLSILKRHYGLRVRLGCTVLPLKISWR